MSQPREPDSVKLVSSIFSPHEDTIDAVIQELDEIFGPPDWMSPLLPFDRTTYYAREMGWPLHRRFVSFQRLIGPDQLPPTKRKTNEVEQRHLRDGKRRANIDPGVVSAERLVLATGKNYVHRIYLYDGIYGDLTLVYRKGSFRPLQWTYPDYAEKETIEMFNHIRDTYMNQLREMRRFG